MPECNSGRSKSWISQYLTMISCSANHKSNVFGRGHQELDVRHNNKCNLITSLHYYSSFYIKYETVLDTTMKHSYYDFIKLYQNS
jgi:hypothetical protein